jgi:hypothetical protein
MTQPKPTAAEALYPHLPSSTPAEVEQSRLRPSLSAAMYQKAAAKDELRAQERQAIWNRAVEAGIRLQQMAKGRR